MSPTHAPLRRRPLPSLDLLRGFEAAARHLSFTRAAEELALTQSAVSRQVQALESYLGLALFERRPRALLLTEAGQILYRTAAEALRSIEQTVARIGSATGTRIVTVTAMPTFAALWLVPRLAEFRRRFPGVDVRISASNEFVDLERSGIDLAVRYVHPGRVPAGTQALFPEQVAPVCSPDLLRDGARPLRRPEDLRHHVLLHMDDAPAASPYLDWNVWLAAVGCTELEPAGALYFSHYDQLIQAAIAGQGVALGRFPLLSAQLRARTLVLPFNAEVAGEATSASRGYFLLLAEGAGERPEVTAFLRWLHEEAAQDRAEPRGT